MHHTYFQVTPTKANKKEPLPETKPANDQQESSKAQKVLIRPSKLGSVLSEEPSSELECPFSRGLGKRQIKPSFKMKEFKSSSVNKQTGKSEIIRESKLVLNQKLLERLRKPSQQVEFYQAIQRSMQSADKTPPKLVQGSSMINPGDFLLCIRAVQKIWRSVFFHYCSENIK